MICQRTATKKEIEKHEHNCFLNWKKASTCMEDDGVLQGFSNSVEMHGLKYKCLFGKFKKYTLQILVIFKINNFK